MYEYIPEVMTFKECKELLKVGKNTLLDLIHTGQIQAFKVGSRWKITKPVSYTHLKTVYHYYCTRMHAVI